MTATALAVIELEVVAREAGLHPEVCERLMRLGLLDGPPFADDAASQLARAARLRRDLGLGWSGAVFACELLRRIDDLEAQVRRYNSEG
ncbi:MAG: chaperone modulatory protein CbpM [Miltoncostaeaceae bacterium]|nr:chaperone modulatory protein CbpM [Miltoncostaeaceae bacterium]